MKPVLCVDSGSTRIKWGLADGGAGWLARGSCGEDGLEELREAAGRAGSALVADVAGPGRVEALRRALRGRDARFITGEDRVPGMRNLYDRPGELGADRWCAAVAAHRMFGACLVALAGTALTLNLVDPEGNFRGGAVLPGVGLMRSSLAGATRLDPVAPPGDAGVPARGTDDAVAAGIRLAAEGAVRLFRERCGASGVDTVVSGGDAGLVSGWLPGAREVPDLVLDGVRMVGGALT